MRNNHKWLALLLCMVLVLNSVSVHASAAQSGSPLALYTDPAAKVGSEVQAQIVATEPGTVADGKLVLTYDADLLTYVGVQTGAAWHDGETVTVSVNAAKGKIILAFANAEPAAAGGLFTLTFRAGTTGTAEVALDSGSYVTGMDAVAAEEKAIAIVDDVVTVHLDAGAHGAFPDGTAETSIGMKPDTALTAEMLPPIIPAQGYTLTGWMTPDGTVYSLSELNLTAAEGLVLTAQYTFVCDGGEGCPSARFTDLTGLSAEAHAAVDFMVDSGYMNGVSGTAFAPLAELNRAMMVTILYRIAGEPAVDGACAFTDVSDARYYYHAVIWASENGITKGISDKLFAPEKPLTRQELVTFLYRFAAYMGEDVSASADLSGYTDADEIGKFAAEAFSWAVAAGVIKGTTETTLSPADTTTRAQVCLMVHRLLPAQN